MKTILIAVAIASLFIATVFLVHAQTNTVAPQNSYTNFYAPPQSFPDTTAADWEKALSDIGIHVNLSSIGGVLFLVYYGSKILRNKTPLGNSPLGNFLSGIVNAETSAPKQLPAPQPQPPKV